MAARALVTPARRIEITMAEPAPTWPLSPLIAVPMAAKIPAPMMAPIPSAVSATGPRVRFMPPPTSPSATHCSTVLRARSAFKRSSDEQRREHQRHGAEQLDQDVQGGARGVLEGIADGVAHDPRLVGERALAAVLPRLDVLLGVVPGAAAVVQHRGHEDAADGPDHQERGDGLGAEPHQPED